MRMSREDSDGDMWTQSTRSTLSTKSVPSTIDQKKAALPAAFSLEEPPPGRSPRPRGLLRNKVIGDRARYLDRLSLFLRRREPCLPSRAHRRRLQQRMT